MCGTDCAGLNIGKTSRQQVDPREITQDQDVRHRDVDLIYSAPYKKLDARTGSSGGVAPRSPG